MMKIKPLTLALCAAILSLGAAGCMGIPDGATPTASSADSVEVSVREVAEEADPAGAIEEIYASLEEYSAEQLDTQAIYEIMGITGYQTEEAFVHYSDPKSGLADIAIFKPNSTSKDAIRESLYGFKDQRIREFENYNILDSYTIAQNALIYDQGEYVILLMLEDNEAAKTIIDYYIPQ
jgi:hypothetical protein